MRSIIFALSFLTVFPASTSKTYDSKTIGRSIAYFPFIGLAIGALLTGFDHLLSPFMTNTLLSMLYVFGLIVVSGGLHMDGLADTADAFYAGRGKEEILNIMKDSCLGTMGALSLIMLITLKIAFIAGLPSELRTPVLLLIPVSGRWAMALSIQNFEYARSSGTASDFFTKSRFALIFSSMFSLAGFYYIMKVPGLLLFIIISAAAYSMALYSKRRLGGVTGDILGALNELTELLFVVLVYALYMLNT